MPEGDTVHYTASRIRPALLGVAPEEIVTPHPRFARDDWPRRLAGRVVTGVEARGKHLLIEFEGGLLIHSHLGMSGAWGVVSGGSPWPRSPQAAWIVLRSRGYDVVEFNGPVLELMTAARARSDPRLARLGPDIVAAAEFDEGRFLRRLREDDPTRPVGETLLDQHTLAGVGNFWKSEGCFLARIDPWRPLGEVSDAEVLRIVAELRPRMQQSARDGDQRRFRAVYGLAGRPCPRCGRLSRIEERGQGDANRGTYWCPRCQI
jgi:endonuclease VIII